MKHHRQLAGSVTNRDIVQVYNEHMRGSGGGASSKLSNTNYAKRMTLERQALSKSARYAFIRIEEITATTSSLGNETYDEYIKP